MDISALRRGWVPRTLWVCTGVASIIGLWGSTAAYAVSSDLTVRVPGDQAGWTSSPTKAMLDHGLLVPGKQTTGSIQLRNNGTTASNVYLKFSKVTGSLAPELRYSVEILGGQAWTGSLATVENGLLIYRNLPADQTVTCDVTESFPQDAGNEWQGATASFDEVFTLEGVGASASTASRQGPLAIGPSTVPSGLGSSVVVPGLQSQSGTTHPDGALAFTGIQLDSLLSLVAGCLALGLAVVVGARRRHVRGTR